MAFSRHSVLFWAVIGLALLASPVPIAANDGPISKDNFDFTAWNTLLQQYVVPGTHPRFQPTAKLRSECKQL